MQILLIDPPFYRLCGFFNRYYPFGLISLATYLRQKGLSRVQVYDADFNEQPHLIDYAYLPQSYPAYLASFDDNGHPVWQEVKQTITEIAPDLIGISLWTTFAASAFHIAKIAKDINPDSVVVMGGPHASAKADEVLRICPDVDYIIRGPGEKSLFELTQLLPDSVEQIMNIKGLSYRQRGTVVHNPIAKLPRDLDSFRFPDRSLLMHTSSYCPEDMGLVMTSRGCPYGCRFCATSGKQVSLRSPAHIVNEIRHVQKHYHTHQFTFKDDSFTLTPKRVYAFCQALLEAGLKIYWECNTRVNSIDEALLRLMKKAGCNFIKVGVESGSQPILAHMNKGISLNQVRRAAKLFRRVGLHWTGYFMMGVPDETEADIQKTIEFMHELEPDFACIGVYEPFPGNEMFDEGVKKGLLRPEMELADFFKTNPNDYYKSDPKRQSNVIEPNRFAILEAEVKKLIHHYNRHPKRVFKMGLAKSKAYIKHPRSLRDDFRKFLSY